MPTIKTLLDQEGATPESVFTGISDDEKIPQLCNDNFAGLLEIAKARDARTLKHALEFIERRDHFRQTTYDKIPGLRSFLSSRIRKALKTETSISRFELLSSLMRGDAGETDTDSIKVVLQFHLRHKIFREIHVGSLIKIAKIALIKGDQELFDLVFNNISNKKMRRFVTGDDSFPEDVHYSIIRTAMVYGRAEAFERIAARIGEEGVLNAIKFDHYFAFRMAMANGHLELAQRVFDLIPSREEKFAALNSLNSDIFRTAVDKGRKDIMDKFRQMIRQSCPEREKDLFISGLENNYASKPIFYFREFFGLLNADEIRANMPKILHFACFDDKEGHLIVRDVAAKINDRDFLATHLRSPYIISAVIKTRNLKFLNAILENLNPQQTQEFLNDVRYFYQNDFMHHGTLFHLVTRKNSSESLQIMIRLLEVASQAQYDAMLQAVVPASCNDAILLVGNLEHLMFTDAQARGYFHNFDEIARIRNFMKEFYIREIEAYVKDERVANIGELNPEERVRQKLLLLTADERFLIDSAVRRVCLVKQEQVPNQDMKNFAEAFGQKSRDEKHVPIPVEIDVHILKFLRPAPVEAGEFTIDDFKQRQFHNDQNPPQQVDHQPLVSSLNEGIIAVRDSLADYYKLIEEGRKKPQQSTRAREDARNLSGAGPAVAQHST